MNRFSSIVSHAAMTVPMFHKPDSDTGGGVAVAEKGLTKAELAEQNRLQQLAERDAARQLLIDTDDIITASETPSKDRSDAQQMLVVLYDVLRLAFDPETKIRKAGRGAIRESYLRTNAERVLQFIIERGLRIERNRAILRDRQGVQVVGGATVGEIVEGFANFLQPVDKAALRADDAKRSHKARYAMQEAEKAATEKAATK